MGQHPDHWHVSNVTGFCFGAVWLVCLLLVEEVREIEMPEIHPPKQPAFARHTPRESRQRGGQFANPTDPGGGPN